MSEEVKAREIEQQKRHQQVEARIQERLRQETEIKTTREAARASVHLKDWSTQITSIISGVPISDGPVVLIRYTLVNPSGCWLKNAKWKLFVYDERGNNLGAITLRSFYRGGMDFIRPGETKKDEFILGYNDMGFSPKLVEATTLSLLDFDLQEEAPEAEKARIREQEKQQIAAQELAKKTVEDQIRRQQQTARKIFEHYSKQATNGDSFSQMRLGELYLEGQGTETNLDLARFWLNKAMENGQPNAAKIFQERLKP